MLFFGIIALEIFLQNLMLSVYLLEPIIAGVISVGIVFPLTAIVTISMNASRRIGDIIGAIIIGTMHICSIAGIFSIRVGSNWIIAMVTGLVAETIGAQTFIMIGSKLLIIS